MLFDQSYTTGVFLNPLKTSWHLWFSDVFKENGKRLVAWNGVTMPNQRKYEFSVNNSSWHVRLKSAASICPNMHFGRYASPIIFSKKLTYSGSYKILKIFMKWIIFTFKRTSREMEQYPIFLSTTSTGSQKWYINLVRWSVKRAHFNTYSLVRTDFTYPGNNNLNQDPLSYTVFKKYFQIMILLWFF